MAAIDSYWSVRLASMPQVKFAGVSPKATLDFCRSCSDGPSVWHRSDDKNLDRFWPEMRACDGNGQHPVTRHIKRLF